MIITNAADRSIRLQSGETVVTVDPTTNRTKADLTLRTRTTFLEATRPDAPISVSGEYELSGIEVRGFALPPTKNGEFATAYALKFEDIDMLIFGADASAPDAKYPVDINSAHVVIAPADSDSFAGSALAAFVRELEPGLIVISSAKSVADVAKIFGVKPETQDKVVFRAKELDRKSPRLVLLDGV